MSTLGETRDCGQWGNATPLVRYVLPTEVNNTVELVRFTEPNGEQTYGVTIIGPKEIDVVIHHTPQDALLDLIKCNEAFEAMQIKQKWERTMQAQNN